LLAGFERLLVGLVAIFADGQTGSATAGLDWIRVADDKAHFAIASTGRSFSPWGFNYDHDAGGRLLEDYWDAEWPKVEKDFRDMKRLGANVVRIHLQFAKFMEERGRPNAKNLAQLKRLVQLGETTRLYLDLTGLGCYHKNDVPGWYDALSEADRWVEQAKFWEAVADACKDSPAVFCYDLMNEPVVPGGKRNAGDWLGPAFAGKHFVQCIALDQAQRPRPEIAQKWIQKLAAAIRRHDQRHLITVGLVDWSLDRPGLTSGFVPKMIAPDLDFLCVHQYPEKGKVNLALETLAGFAVGKPVVIEETFPLKCSMSEFADFINGSRKAAAGHMGFYWGKTPEELRESKTIADAITLQWLEFFAKEAKK
jgi:hypothetical protein